MRIARRRRPALLGPFCALLLAGCTADGEEPATRLGSESHPTHQNAALAAGRQEREVLGWSFANGLFPDGWGWGDWYAEDGALVCCHESDWIACYFIPYPCPKDFVIETRVMFVSGQEGKRVSAQLLVRDSEALVFESGLALYPDEDAISCRHLAWKRPLLQEVYPAGMAIDYGRWYTLCFSITDGRLRAELDGRRLPVPDISYPIGAYCEPHLAVENGCARFDYVRIFALR